MQWIYGFMVLGKDAYCCQSVLYYCTLLIHVSIHFDLIRVGGG